MVKCCQGIDGTISLFTSQHSLTILPWEIQQVLLQRPEPNMNFTSLNHGLANRVSTGLGKSKQCEKPAGNTVQPRKWVVKIAPTGVNHWQAA